MINQYPWWKNLLIVVVVLVSALYALPNLYGEDPAVQISSNRGVSINDATVETVRAELKRIGIDDKRMEMTDRGLIVRFANTEDQLRARDNLEKVLTEGYILALNLAPATPDWLRAMGGQPMYLGLDLRGGVHFLMEVDTDAAVAMAEERYVGDFRMLLRGEKIRYLTIKRNPQGGVDIKFRTADVRAKAENLIRKEYRDLIVEESEGGNAYFLKLKLGKAEIRETRSFAVQQNITTLRNRVNELGVAEPLIQRQGESRIVVQLPGVQDTARAKEILGATATLEYRMADESHDVQDAINGRVPAGTRLYKKREGGYVLLKNRIIVTGDSIVDARSGIDTQDGSPMVTVTLDAKGAKKMLNNTKENVGKLMAVVYIENKIDTKVVDGEVVKTKRVVEEVISLATIREPFGKRFQTTGLDSAEEGRDLALLLLAHALSAPP